jgi:glycosyltransferase involved in cell wall biosynthesis
MNEVYNLMDVFYLSTSGEGFGIPIIEAMACEVPVVATDYTTTPELVKENNAGYGAKLVGTEDVGVKEFFNWNSSHYDNLVANGTMTGSWEVERGMVDLLDAAIKIESIYKNPDEAVKMGKNGRKAVEEKYDFDTIVGPSWEKVING